MGNVVTCFGKKSGEIVINDPSTAEKPKKEKVAKPKKEKQEKPKKEKPEKPKKEKKDKKGGGGDANGDGGTKEKSGSASKNGAAKTGSAISTAKVRPMTQSDNIPKPVAFEISLDEKAKAQAEAEANRLEEEAKDKLAAVADDSSSLVGTDTPRLQTKFPRRLPKLSSLGKSWSINENKTPEDILKKQKKAEEKRNEILEGKKQKARKFVEKFTNKSQDSDSKEGQEQVQENNGSEESNKEEAVAAASTPAATPEPQPSTSGADTGANLNENGVADATTEPSPSTAAQVLVVHGDEGNNE